VANVERKFPTEWMNDAHNGVTEQAIRYLRPLIQGEVSVPKQNGLPAHMVL
ncbi:MAG TPA: 6-phosphofructokinase, partial [Ruminococcaceae bacterium]|nr:6-phosphofructokinase [Oscillospiraceae bacterium]